jgi:hypothetical protein
MGETAAQHASESFADFLIGSIRFYVEDSFGCQDYATQAKSALSGAFVNEGLLDRVRFFRCAEAFEGRDFILANRAHWHDAGSHDLAAQDYGAGSALGHAAPELRPTQSKFVAQNEEQRCLRIQIESVHTAVDFEGNLGHGNLKINCNLKQFRRCRSRVMAGKLDEDGAIQVHGIWEMNFETAH